MGKNQTLKLASVIFGLIALLHLFRAVFNLTFLIGDFAVPVYFSYISFILLGYLSWLMFNSSK